MMSSPVMVIVGVLAEAVVVMARCGVVPERRM
jgi:hypothetical protein